MTAVIVLGVEALFVFVSLFSQTVATLSSNTLRELPPDPVKVISQKKFSSSVYLTECPIIVHRFKISGNFTKECFDDKPKWLLAVSAETIEKLSALQCKERLIK